MQRQPFSRTFQTICLSLMGAVQNDVARNTHIQPIRPTEIATDVTLPSLAFINGERTVILSRQVDCAENVVQFSIR